MDDAVLKSPFPYAGGKSRVADAVWSRLGNPDNFVEPFAGSLAVLLRRPAGHFAGGYRVETVNDANHYLVNFWRAVRHAPEEVAEYADWPVTEADLHARHRWLVRSDEAAAWRKRMAEDPECYDAKIAGWWCWGACCWIGSGWCVDGSPAGDGRPLVNGDGKGYGLIRGPEAGGSTDWEQMPRRDAVGVLSADGIPPGESQKRAALGNRRGVTSAVAELGEGRPQLTDALDIGRGVNGGAALQRPHLTSGAGDGVLSVARPAGNDHIRKRQDLGHELGIGVLTAPVNPAAGTCDARRAWLVAWMRRLSDRLRLVRTCYGHWARVCDSDSTLTRLGVTGVFLDPPYPIRSTNGKKSRADGLYANDKGQDLDRLRDEVLAWCRRWGGDPAIRIAVCGYEGDGYEALEAEGWSVQAWEASGGYGNQRKKGKGAGKADNAKRERIWYSPSCEQAVEDLGLFNEEE